ncbi:MAG: UbiA family prenyltransferase [Candidatus Undinarchaeales archaeon]
MAEAGIFEKLIYLFKSTRPLNIVMVTAGILITILIGTESLGSLRITVPALIAAVAISSAGNSINDYYDIDIDKVNKPEKPLPSGKLKKNEMLYFSIILFALGIGVSFLLPYLCIFLAVINSVLLWLYASELKRSGFLGNIIISYLVASVFIFGAAAIGNLLIGVFLAVVAFFTNASRELLKDLEDIKGDKEFGAETFPMIIGSKKKTIVVIDSFLIVAVLISPLPYLIGLLSLYYMVFAVVADLVMGLVVYSVSHRSTLKTIKRNQKRVKIAALIGLLAFLAGIVPFTL